jgi:hypothetical protein
MTCKIYHIEKELLCTIFHTIYAVSYLSTIYGTLDAHTLLARPLWRLFWISHIFVSSLIE